MRFNEFEKDALKNISERQVDEALPAIAGGIARGVAGAAGMAAKGAAKVGKAIGTAAKQVGGKAVKKAAGTGMSTAQRLANKTQDKLSQQLVKKGKEIPMPTQKGKTLPFKIDDVKNDEVTLINPDASKAPEEPEKVTYKKKDIDTIVQQLAQNNEVK